jgi:uncharacterized protein
MPLKNWIFVLILALGASIGDVVTAQSHGPMRTVVVIANGSASAAPDKAVISLGARHAAKTAVDALAKTNEAVAAILLRMDAMGVDSKDIQTASLNLRPVWRDNARDENGEMLPPVGFEASNSIQVTLRDLDKLGDVLDQVTRDGANSFSGFQLGLVDPSPILDQARMSAISEARRRAELYASAAGITLGEILLITEDLNDSGGMPAPMMEMSMSRSSAGPIAQGEVSQTERVKVVFAIVE